MNILYDNLVWITYLFTRVDEVKNSLLGMTYFAFMAASVALLFLVVIALHKNDGDKPDQCVDRFEKNHGKTLRRIRNYSIGLWLLCWAMNTLIPDRNDVALIIGVALGSQAAVSVAKNVAESPITNKALQLLEAKIDEALQETANKTSKSTTSPGTAMLKDTKPATAK